MKTTLDNITLTPCGTLETIRKSLFEVSESTREKALKFLVFYTERGYTKAMAAAKISWMEINACMKASEMFRKLVKEMRHAHDEHSAQKILEIMEAKAEDGNVKAAELVLPAYDSRFRPNAPMAAQTVNIQINL